MGEQLVADIPERSAAAREEGGEAEDEQRRPGDHPPPLLAARRHVGRRHAGGVRDVAGPSGSQQRELRGRQQRPVGDKVGYGGAQGQAPEEGTRGPTRVAAHHGRTPVHGATMHLEAVGTQLAATRFFPS